MGSDLFVNGCDYFQEVDGGERTHDLKWWGKIERQKRELRLGTLQEQVATLANGREKNCLLSYGTSLLSIEDLEAKATSSIITTL